MMEVWQVFNKQYNKKGCNPCKVTLKPLMLVSHYCWNGNPCKIINYVTGCSVEIIATQDHGAVL